MANSVKKTIVTAIVASSLGISGAFELSAQNFSEEKAIEGAIGAVPLNINMEEVFFGNEDQKGLLKNKPTEPIIIDDIEFITKADTRDLPEYKDYLVQGIFYYTDMNGEFQSTVFKDRVGIDSKEYKLVSRKESTKSKIHLKERDGEGLNMDLSNCTFEFTWVTPSAISICDIKATDTKGKVYKVAPGEIYTAYVTEKEVPVTKNTNSRLPLNSEKLYVSSVYGDDNGRYHDGWDICLDDGEDRTIYATHSGTVQYANWENPSDLTQGFGQYVQILGDDGYRNYYYGHCSDLYVSKGEYVEAGQPIAKMGNTGYSTGEHLHYCIRTADGDINVAEDMGLPNEYGYVDVSEYIESVPESEAIDITDAELAIKALSFNKYFEAGTLKANAINPNDNGAVSIGIIQMRGSNAKDLLTAIRKKNTNEFDRIANKYDSRITSYINDDKWESRTAEAGTPLFKFLSEVLIQEWAVDAQWDFIVSHEINLINDARRNGIKDERCILLYTRAYNYGPYTGSCSRLRDLGNAGNCTWENAAATVEFLKANEAIRLVDEMSFPILTKNDIK